MQTFAFFILILSKLAYAGPCNSTNKVDFQGMYAQASTQVTARLAKKDARIKSFLLASTADGNLSLQLLRHDGSLEQTKTYLEYTLDDASLAFTIFVEPDLRQMGLSNLMILDLLQRHPQVYRLPTTLTGLNESFYLVSAVQENKGEELQRLAQEALGSKEAYFRLTKRLQEKFASMDEGQPVKDMRRKLIAAVSETPAFKSRKRLGFAFLAEIELTVHEFSLGIDLEFEKGPPNPHQDSIRVLVTSGEEKVALLPDGTTLPVDEDIPPALRRGQY